LAPRKWSRQLWADGSDRRIGSGSRRSTVAQTCLIQDQKSITYPVSAMPKCQAFSDGARFGARVGVMCRVFWSASGPVALCACGRGRDAGCINPLVGAARFIRCSCSRQVLEAARFSKDTESRKGGRGVEGISYKNCFLPLEKFPASWSKVPFYAHFKAF